MDVFLSQAFHWDIRLRRLGYTKSGGDFADPEVDEESNLA